MAVAWKQHEKRTAAALGGRRVGNLGTSTADVDAGGVLAECKHRRVLPGWLTLALGKVRVHAGSDRLGVVVLHQARAHDSIVCMALSDFVAWHGPVAGSDRDQDQAGG